MTEQERKQAQFVYDTLCKFLTDDDWDFQKSPEEFQIISGIQGDDLPIDFIIKVDAERALLMFVSLLPVEVSKNRIDEINVAISIANNGLTSGHFVLYPQGQICFRMASCYRDCLVGKDLFQQLILGSCCIIEHYNDKFEKFAKSDMSIEEIIQNID